MRELLRGLAVLVEPPEPGADASTARIARALELPEPPPPWRYTSLFLEQLYPYASVYLGDEGKLGGEARDRVAGFWRALGETPPAEPDHLAVLLGLAARLEELEEEADGARADAWRRARGALLHEHLLSWLVPWLARLDEVAPDFYRAWGRTLEGALGQLRADLEPPDELPAALREAGAPPVPEEAGGRAFLAGLLSPVRTGMILVRDDLARAATELELALRVGERRWVLEAFLQQEPQRILAWLAAEARRQADVLEAGDGDLVRAFWVRRARDTGAILEEAARQAAQPGGAADTIRS